MSVKDPCVIGIFQVVNHSVKLGHYKVKNFRKKTFFSNLAKV